MSEVEREELVAVLTDLQVRVSKLAGTVEYLAEVLAAADVSPIDQLVLQEHAKSLRVACTRAGGRPKPAGAAESRPAAQN